MVQNVEDFGSSGLTECTSITIHRTVFQYTYITVHRTIACVAWRFWLGALSNKGGRGQRNREEIGAGATFSRGFAARSRALRTRILRLGRSCARLDKTAMLRRLHGQKKGWITASRNKRPLPPTPPISDS